MKPGLQRPLFAIIFLCIILCKCADDPGTIKSAFRYTPPDYSGIELVPQKDTIHFALSENTYNSMESLNYFTHKGAQYLSFHDDRSGSINIYEFTTGTPIKRIDLKKWLKDQKLYKTTVYTRNFDSIFITNQRKLYLFDSAGTVRKMIDFTKAKDEQALFDNTQPPLLLSNKLYMGVRPWMNETSLSSLKKWKPIYCFDLDNKEQSLYYSLPEIYSKQLYGYSFLNYSYCINNKGHFVFSFPADTNIYETNFSDYNLAYNSRSRYQDTDIEPLTEKEIKNDPDGKEFRLRHSYGYIYFDPYHKRYLRFSRQRLTNEVLKSDPKHKKQSVILFDENFTIIGEHLVSNDFSFSSLFFTKDGSLYARIKAKDEYVLYFVRQSFAEHQEAPVQLTKN